MKEKELNWMPAIVQKGQTYLRVDGIFELIDIRLNQSGVPKREKDVLRNFKNLIKQMDENVLKAYNSQQTYTPKTFDA